MENRMSEFDVNCFADFSVIGSLLKDTSFADAPCGVNSWKEYSDDKIFNIERILDFNIGEHVKFKFKSYLEHMREHHLSFDDYLVIERIVGVFREHLMYDADCCSINTIRLKNISDYGDVSKYVDYQDGTVLYHNLFDENGYVSRNSYYTEPDNLFGIKSFIFWLKEQKEYFIVEVKLP